MRTHMPALFFGKSCGGGRESPQGKGEGEANLAPPAAICALAGPDARAQHDWQKKWRKARRGPPTPLAGARTTPGPFLRQPGYPFDTLTTPAQAMNCKACIAKSGKRP